MSENAKIFGIGLSKTGTSSLAQALQRLGYRTKDCMGATTYVRGDLSSIDMDTVLAHDALTDTPIPSFYRELDARFPGSKFILTVRDRDGWLQSCRKQFNERSAAAQNDAHRRLFEDFYGTNVFDEQKFAAGYDRFVAGVREYFRDRPGDLLELNVSAGEGWDRLCPFLGRPVPDVPFPKANVTSIRWIDIEELASLAETAGRELLQRFSGADSARSGARRPVALTRLLHRVIGAASGQDSADSAARAAMKVISAGLRRRCPEIPILSPLDEVPSFSIRKQWNHVWLIDPLDGAEAFAHGSSNFTVNVALVEDGRPIYGVVHAPALGVTYLARAGKGVRTRELGAATAPTTACTGDAAERSSQATEVSVNGSLSLALCALLEGAGESALWLPAVEEWRVAAGHAVISTGGKTLLVDESGVEYAFNSEGLAIGNTMLVAGRHGEERVQPNAHFGPAVDQPSNA